MDPDIQVSLMKFCYKIGVALSKTFLSYRMDQDCQDCFVRKKPGPGCSELMRSLVNVSLKFQTLISQIHRYFFF